MSRVFYAPFCLLLLFSLAFATPPAFSSEHSFELGKDEWAIVRLVDLSTSKEEEFSFSWRLFDHTNLIVQSFYRLYPRQLVLSLRVGQKTASYILRPPTRYPPVDEVRLLLSFEEFARSKAKLHIGIIDPASRMSAQFIDPKR